MAALAVFGLASCEDVPSPFDLPNNNGGSEIVSVEPKGDGSATNPFNVKGLTQWIEANESTARGKEVYVEAIISSIKSLDVSKYTRAQYYINDTESTTGQFYVYNGLYLNGANFTANDQIKVGDKVLIKGSIDQYNGSFQIGQNSTILSLNGSNEGGEIETPVDAIEKTCAEAAEICKALDDNASSVETFSITGYITDVFANVSMGQQSFWMADTKDGGKVIQAYWANLPEGVASFTKGSKVKIVGKLLKYVNNSTGAVTAEVKNADVEILEAGSGDNDEPTIPGDATEITCAKAVELCAALEDKTESTDIYTVTGYITETDGKISRNQQVFWMDDTKDGGKVFQAYWANIPDPTKALPVGTKVKMTGKLKRFGETAEMQNGIVVVLEMGEGGDKEDDKEDDNKGDDQNVGTVDARLVMSALYDITEGSVDAGTITSNGVTLTFDKNGGNNVPKFYWNEKEEFKSVRMYAKNSMQVTASKKIESIKINCTAANGSTLYNGNPTMTTSAGSLTQNSDNVTVVVTGINSTTVTITNEHSVISGGTQLRIRSVEIIYAK